jgi:hypothetical protein
MYTDGMTELVPGASRSQGLEALIDACVGVYGVPISQAADAVAARVRGTGSLDDLLLMAIEVTA